MRLAHGAVAHWPQLPFALAILVLCVVLTVSLLRISYDDAFITYRVARNLVRGEGLVFNRGEPWLATTAPLLAMILGFLSWVTGIQDFPALGGLVSGIGLLVSSLAVWRLAARMGRPWAGMIAAVVWTVNRLNFWVFGGESTLHVSLVLLAVHAHLSRRHLVAGVFVGLGALTRGEAGLLLPILLVHAWLERERRVKLARLVAGFLGVWIPWAAYSMATYGSPLPSTLEAKLAQGASGVWLAFPRGAVEWFRGAVGMNSVFPGLGYASWIWILVPFVPLGLARLLGTRSAGGGRIVLAWVTAFGIGYTALNVPFYHWYIMPIVLALSMVIGEGISWTAGKIALVSRRWEKIRLGWTVAWAMALAALGPFLIGEARALQRYVASQPAPAEAIYTQAGRWLAANTPDRASVGYFEIGFLGYHSDRTIVDPVGLVNPGVAEKLAQRDFWWAYLRYQPDYIVHNTWIFTELIGNISEEPWFQQAYVPITTISSPGYPGELVVFRKINSQAIPDHTLEPRPGP